MRSFAIDLRRRALQFILLTLLNAALAACAGAAGGQPASAPTASGAEPARLAAIPLLAYYYIWFDTKSWDRAKTDLPQLGPYSSDDRQVMQQHIRWAKAAGIKGFIVSWKSTDTLNRRLRQLIEVANEEHFKLLMIYQGLDFERNPLDADRVAADLDYFIQQFAGNQVFDMFERPVMIWSGTWKFSYEDIARVTEGRRQHLLILASERSPADYQRLAQVVDGDAYYWSSVNPETFPNYQGKLDAMAQAVHASHGLWLAPAAAGFDARLIGGTSVVERKDGQTLQRQISAALNSSPDAIGLISWNEFSENSYVEPSQAYGRRYLDVLAGLPSAAAPAAVGDRGDFDSSMPGDTGHDGEIMTPVAAIAIVTLLSLSVIIWRALHTR